MPPSIPVGPKCSRIAAVALVATIHVVELAPVAAQDKSGVSPSTISRPSGPGSLEGLGDAFQPALNTGTARYNYAFKLPAGVGGASPGLVLHYDSGLGFGPAGIGWTFDPGSVRRQADKGIPQYIDVATPSQLPDRFLGMDGEELVPLQNGYFLAKIEGGFVRYRRVGDGWEAHARDGTKFEFGSSDAGRISDVSGVNVYRWCLERRTDTHGNVVTYSYVRPDKEDRQIYLSEIRYGPGSPPWKHSYSAKLSYEDRPDPRTDYRSGFMVRATKRLGRVDVCFDDALIRRYELGYAAHPHWSLLTTITPTGADAVSTLPTTTFGYAVFDPGDPNTPVSAIGNTIGSLNEPSSVFDNGKVDLIDLNSDGLPDLLSTDLGHAAYLNRGIREVPSGVPAVRWEGPLAVDAVDVSALNRDLSQSNIHLADMTGDGLADLVVTEPKLVQFYENRGALDWGSNRLMSVGKSPPPAPFGDDALRVRTVDLDFDKRMDILKSDSGAYSAWFNLGDGRYSEETLLDGSYHHGQFVDFADRGVDLADVNGDRLSDIVKITATSVVYFPSMGRGRFDDAVEMFLPDRALDDFPDGNLSRAKMTDVNGDGLSDVVVERAQGSDLWFWLNLGNGTLAPSRVITGIPAASPSAAVRWADINGNGTTDLLYGDSSLFDSKLQAVDLAVLIAGSPTINALTSIDNGYGRRTTIEYRSSTEYYLDAYDAGHPWTTAVAFPVQVVSRTLTSIGLDLDGYANEGADGDVYVGEFVYRDGYYDPLEKQFRGFGFVKKIERGDERFGGSRAPTLVTRMAFHTGAPDGVDNDQDGETDEFDLWVGREEEVLKGVELWHERTSLPDDMADDGDFADDGVVFDRVVNTWMVRDLCTADGGPLPAAFTAGYQTSDDYDRPVRLAVRTRTQTTLIERDPDPGAYKNLEQRTDLDEVGNTAFEQDRGDLSDPNDDLYTAYEYARNEPAWVVDRVSRVVQRAGDEFGPFVSETRNYYDGSAFVGLPLGQVGIRGNLHRAEALISGDPVPALTDRSFLRGDPRDPAGRVDTLRQRFDEFGNVIISLDAEAALNGSGEPDGAGHERRIDFDPLLRRFPVRETIIIGAPHDDLHIDATHDYRFETPLTVSDFNGNITRYVYDPLGRLEREILPGDDPVQPTRQYSYDWGAPLSATTTIAHTVEGESPDVVTTRYFDGMGRSLGTFETGGPAMNGVTLYNPRGQAWRTAQPYHGQPTDGEGAWLLPSPDAPSMDTRYDELGRSVEVLTPPDGDGVRARRTTRYRPLMVIESDGEDNLPGGPHAGTPKTLIHDGMNRLIEVREVEALSTADPGTFVTRYRYTLPDLLAEVEDANGNIKYMRHDALGREIFMNDCDRGHMTNTYDAVGNLLSTVDAKNQRIDYTYDGANRLLSEDYVDDASPLSLHRSPDVTYHYDRPSAHYPWHANTRGQLAWVEDLTGTTFQGFDARANMERVVKRIDQADGSTRDYTTVTLSDSLGRGYQTVYPDGSVVRRSYDDRGLLATIPGFVDAITYRASAQKETCAYANGVTTTYAYDPRLRMTALVTASATETLQHLGYSYDQADNIVGVTDGRVLEKGDPRSQTAMFELDDSYRLQRAVGDGYGTIRYDYDRIGNMVTKTSPDIADPLVNMGTMDSGGIMGTAGRIGRAAADPPGPHALTSITGTTPREYGYDANGNMIAQGSAVLTFDFKDRLGQVSKDGKEARYLYDFTDRRVIKRVDDQQTTYISKLSEIRDGQMMQYVFAGPQRVARFEGALDPPEQITQRVQLQVGWNLISFQVDPGETDPAVLLADIADSVSAVFGYANGAFASWRPGDGDDTLSAMYPNRGYWFHMTAPAELTLTGSLHDGGDDSKKGWQLVGVSGLAPSDRTAAQGRFPDAESIWTYAGDEFGWRVIYLDEPAYVSNLSATSPGLGYWVSPRTAAQEGVAVLMERLPPGPIERTLASLGSTIDRLQHSMANSTSVVSRK